MPRVSYPVAGAQTANERSRRLPLAGEAQSSDRICGRGWTPAIGSVRRPSRGRGATGEMRRFRTLPASLPNGEARPFTPLQSFAPQFCTRSPIEFLG